MKDKNILEETAATSVHFSIKEAIQEIVDELTTYEGIQDDNPDVSKCLLLVGEAGMGKTRLVKQAADLAGAKFISFHHGAAIIEDHHGLPYVENGVTKHAQAAHLAEALVKPGEVYDEQVPIVLFMDEIFSGSVDHQNVARMIIDRRMNEARLKSNVRIVAATNPEGGEYCTVRSADRALASRMVPLHIKPTDEERMEYWRERMPCQTLYSFLLLHMFKDNSYIKAADSRTWFNLAHTLAKREASRASHDRMLKLVHAVVNGEVAAAYGQYLINRGDPSKYPIMAKELIEADEEQFGVLMARLSHWVKSDERSPLVGATKWDICSVLRDTANHKHLSKRAVKNIAKFCVFIGTNGYAALAEDIFNTVVRTPLLQQIIDHVKDTELKTRMIQLHQQMQKVKQTSVAPAPKADPFVPMKPQAPVIQLTPALPRTP